MVKVNISDELINANKILAFQYNEKEKSSEKRITTKNEYDFQYLEKEKPATELQIHNYARILIEASIDPFFTINPTCKITYMNNA